MTDVLELVANWTVSFALHSTACLAIAWLLSRVVTLPGSAWKVAMLVPLVTASVAVGGADEPVVAQGVELPPESVVTNWEPSLSSPSSAASADPTLPEIAAEPLAWSLPAEVQWGIAGAVLLLLGFGLARFGVMRLRLQRALRSRVPATSPPLLSAFAHVCRRAGVRRRIRLSTSETLTSGVAFGTLRREICIPERSLRDLDPAALRALLAHELAHLVRRDPLWLEFASALCSMFPWQPLLRVARSEMVASAELRCDEMGARWTDPVAVADCLVEVASWQSGSNVGRFAISGMAVCRAGLGTRVDRLLAERRRGLGSHWLAAIVCFGQFVIAPELPNVRTDVTEALAGEALDAELGPVTSEAGPWTRAFMPLLIEIELETLELRRELLGLRGDVAELGSPPELIRLLAEIETRVEILESLRRRILTWLVELDAKRPADESNPERER